MATTIERFLVKVDKTETCWWWKPSVEQNDYGHFDSRPAHQVSYELFVGEIPEGLEIHHKCNNPPCVNPEHLEPMTHAENIRQGRSFNGSKTHCPKGHPYDEANTYISSQGARICRACRDAYQKAYLARRTK